MARDHSPIVKQSRREGVALAPKAHKVMAKKSGIPGEHAGMRMRGGSLYLTQLREKQKAKRYYGLLENQFYHYFELASKMTGKTGENLLKVLESRLDNVVYRAGFAMSRPEARQLVSHGHFTVNGKAVNIPSYLVKAGDVVAIVEKSMSSDKIKGVLEANASRPALNWLSVDKNKAQATVVNLPERGEIDLQVEEQLIVELYSK